ncbi:MAG: TolC family protein, partial [Verrucomicrobiae bacterium]|nr:TolC family protein [Verrucomicrobiae bacterium]
MKASSVVLFCGAAGLIVNCAWQTKSAEAIQPDFGSVALTVDALVAEVIQKNLELDFYRAELAAAKGARRSAGEWQNPEVTASLGSKRVWERHGPPLGDGVAWSASVAQPIEWPGRIALRKAIANKQIELAEIGLEQFQATIAARARVLA